MVYRPFILSQWLLEVPPSLTIKFLHSANRAYLQFYVIIRTAITSLYSIKRLIFIIEMKCVYCALRT
jgi:hypothetical protein